MSALRPNQERILEYTGGKMAILAVPGSGKTWTLSRLAAELIASGRLGEEQEILVVTLVNSAVNNFYNRVRSFLDEMGYLNLGYRVRTLHGLAHDIVRARPDLVGLPEGFLIIDDREADAIRHDAVQAWLSTHASRLDDFLDPEMDESRRDWIRREQLPRMANDIAVGFIRTAKDRQLSPEQLRTQLDRLAVPLPLAEMGWQIYHDYQRALVYRGGLDFDDLIRYALTALQSDPAYLARLRAQWPFILEDEAQDSSRLQEQILNELSGPAGNWVRVGDPNQAIFETFTTANPRFLREFAASPYVVRRELPHSGRSQPAIIRLANHLVTWTQSEHPVEQVRAALQAPPLIEPTPSGDPQPNPPDRPALVRLIASKFSPEAEIDAVVDSLARWLPENPGATVAILEQTNNRAEKIVSALRRRQLPVVDALLRTSLKTRASADTLEKLLAYMADPGNSQRLAHAYRVWRGAAGDDPDLRKRIDRTAELLRKIPQVEDFIWPTAGADWLETIGLLERDPEAYDSLVAFRRDLRRWQGAVLLPVDQMVLTLAQEVFTETTELALSHKFALLLRQASQANPAWRLPELKDELAVIARNERRFLGFSEDDLGFNPDRYPGQVVVATVHKAKGLEWDRVYLMALNDYNFPSGQPSDSYYAERWYMRPGLNLEAEILAQLDSAYDTGEFNWYEEGRASEQSRYDVARERLRLLYVGITRARRELILTWNTGKRHNQLPAAPFLELLSYQETQEDAQEPEA